MWHRRRWFLTLGLLGIVCAVLLTACGSTRTESPSGPENKSPTLSTRPSGTPPPFLDLGAVATRFPESVFLTPPAGETATVTRIIDGDTIEVLMNGRTYRVRYIGMDTPERYDVCFAEATAANALLVANQEVTLLKDVSETDRYGRLVRYVFVGSVFVDAALVAQGYARAYPYPPDTTYADYFADLEARARAAGLGCHPTGVFDHDPQTGVPVTASVTSAVLPPTSELPTPLSATGNTTQTAPAVFTCDCSRKCSEMVSCEEAYFQLSQCGCGVRDGDGDGVPCETICPGG
jgi:endonuclease YncB( thermonuclease family)